MFPPTHTEKDITQALKRAHGMFKLTIPKSGHELNACTPEVKSSDQTMTPHDDSRSPSLSVRWGQVTDKNIKQVKQINQTLFPIDYGKDFYKEATRAPPGFATLLYFNDLPVAVACCRKEPYSPAPSEESLYAPNPDDPPRSTLYILTLGVLAPYRERGLGTELVNHVLYLAHNSHVCADVVDVCLHVQEGNDDALRLYQKHGFTVTGKIVGYYRRITPADCHVLRKPIDRA